MFIDIDDAAELGICPGDPVRLRSATGVYEGRARVVRLPARTLQVHWPEGTVVSVESVNSPSFTESKDAR